MKKVGISILQKKYNCDICGTAYLTEIEKQRCETAKTVSDFIKSLERGKIYYVPWMENGSNFNTKFWHVARVSVDKKPTSCLKDNTNVTCHMYGQGVDISSEFFLDDYTPFSKKTVEEKINKIKEVTVIEALDLGWLPDRSELKEPGIKRTMLMWLSSKDTAELAFYLGKQNKKHS